MKSLLAVVGVVSVSGLTTSKGWDNEFTLRDHVDYRRLFHDWQTSFGRDYSSLEEESHRFGVWSNNLDLIRHHNSDRHSSFTMRMNQFGDLTKEEFQSKMLGYKGGKARKDRPKGIKSISSLSVMKSAPDSIDWTDVNGTSYVTPVKNQGDCGSCWAFSTTGSLECRTAIATGTLTSLSEQQLVDCSDREGNLGCDGGIMDQAFEYVEKEGGLCSEEEYPYKARDGTCKEDSCGTLYSPISNYNDVTSDDSTDLMDNAANGCVSVAVDASDWQFYSRGVYSRECGDLLDHGVLVVGYGSDDGDEYWKVKNSWGKTWGMEGYILLCRDCGHITGECGILREPSYPDPKDSKQSVSM